MTQVVRQETVPPLIDTSGCPACADAARRESDAGPHRVAIEESPSWRFFSTHGHVLLAIAEQPTARVREIAQRTGITERAAIRIIGELVGTGYVSAWRVGRRNVYAVDPEMPLRHPHWRHRTVRCLLGLLRPEEPARAREVRLQTGDGQVAREAEP